MHSKVAFKWGWPMGLNISKNLSKWAWPMALNVMNGLCRNVVMGSWVGNSDEIVYFWCCFWVF